MPARHSGAQRLIAFLQSRDHDGDAFVSGSSTASWLAGHGALPANATATDDDARHARRLRAALLALVQDRQGALSDPRTARILSSVSHAAPLAVVAEGAGVRLAACGA